MILTYLIRLTIAVIGICLLGFIFSPDVVRGPVPEEVFNEYDVYPYEEEIYR